MTNYKEMSDGQMTTVLGVEAVKWADAFVEVHGGDHELMFGWFANAIMAGIDHANGGGPICGDHAEFLQERAKVVPTTLDEEFERYDKQVTARGESQ